MGQEIVTINKGTCERLCREVCRNFVTLSSRSAHLESLLLAICQEIYYYLGEDFVLIPIQNSSHLETYKSNLQFLVSGRQTEAFDVVEIIDHYISETLNKKYQLGFKVSLAY